MANLIEDGRIFENSRPRDFLIYVTGAPTLEYSVDGTVGDFGTARVVDLTVSPSFPNCEVSLPACKFRFALNGGTAELNSL